MTDKQSEPYKEGYEVGVKLAPHRDKFPEVVSVPVRWASDPGPRRADGWTEAAHAYVDGVQDGWTDNH
ncbi:Uncharacterised protein [Mycobacteroides abscessus subsp. bolletii]|uniref:hypothetical protein n=1 Tax=Mycobacteroides abscessus TaxID=36809 RepID=UPI0009A88730|nr:hypothetical protein [Mycobacteroides abscessus]SKR94589.1 Uncharacterised protein [Mycobacteroides abscessus subsp. bolletii]SKS02850.1 Uncharacterised protein [Mycobacteroides abscessus subsp. bolletii]DAZ90173.1 TPA_asm: hypothetical protein PROPHIFVLQ01-1_87 [Mycobacterium phage prophiFVLQ01-1]